MTPGFLKRHHTFCKEHVTTGLKNIGDIEELQYLSGRWFERKVTEIRTGQGYTTDVRNKSQQNKSLNSLVDIDVIETSTTACHFRVEFNMYAYRKIPRPFWPLYARLFLLPLFRNYLNASLNGIKESLETHSAVERNKYGKLRGFS